MSHLASSALSRFGLREPRVVGLLQASSRNDNFLVEDAFGERYVLRRYRRNPKQERIEFQLGFQQHLVCRGFPTSRVVVTRGGQRMVVRRRDVWTLFTYVEGAEYDYGREEQVRGPLARPVPQRWRRFRSSRGAQRHDPRRASLVA